MSNTCLKNLLAYMRSDSITCDFCTLSSYINILEIMLHHYPHCTELKEMRTQFLKQINDNLEIMYGERWGYYD